MPESRKSHGELLRSLGVKEWNLRRAYDHDTIPMLFRADLSGLDLRGVFLMNANMAHAKLSAADLRDSQLFQAELHKADLSGADLAGADMRGAKLHGADLSGASLRGANLYRVDFIETKLDDTDFTEAYCHTTAFSGVDLSVARGLDEIIPGAPCHVSTSTLERTVHAGLPEEFLRSVGVPGSLFTHPWGETEQRSTQSCFLSYSSVDLAFVKQLYQRLRSNDVTTWFAPEDLRGGDKVLKQIREAIDRHDRILVVLSQSSLSSTWVAAELRNAIESKARHGEHALFPIRICSYDELQAWSLPDPASGNDIAAEVREYHIPDFSNWKDPQAFSDAVANLLRDLA